MRERRSGAGRTALAAALFVLLSLAAPFAASSASAHPLGNFTVNRWARIEPTAGVIRITYVLDIAEIPSFQDRSAIDADAPGYARGRADAVARAIELRVDGGGPQPMAVRDVRIDRPQGDGGLRTTRIAMLLESTVSGSGLAGSHELTYADGSEPDRLGWREIVARGPTGTVLRSTWVPTDDRSDQLRQYPKSRLSSPIDVRKATVAFETTDLVAPAPALEGAAAARPTDRLGRLLDSSDSGAVTVLGLLAVAFLIGCGHALAPGHGKTIMAAYLVGTRGRPADAVLLGVIVSAMHTTSVLLLGLVLHQIDRSVAIDRIYPALTVASGVIVVLFGGWLVWTHGRRLRADVPVARDHEHDHHDHDHDHHDHGHHGGHAHGHGNAAEEQEQGHGGEHIHGPGGHTHELPEGVAPLSKRGLVVLATSGGIVPSPSAVVVLVSSLTLGRIGLGLGLIVAFSIGLAVTLSAVGLALVFGRRVADARLSANVIRLFPVLGAAAVLLLGAVLVIQGVQSL